MGVFGAVFGSRGDAGFSGAFLGVSSGVVGFNVAMFVCPVREICRPARPGVGASAIKFALQARNGRKTLFLGLLGSFSRRGRVGRVFSRQPPLRRSWMQRGAVHVGVRGGFAALGAECQRVGGVSRF